MTTISSSTTAGITLSSPSDVNPIVVNPGVSVSGIGTAIYALPDGRWVNFRSPGTALAVVPFVAPLAVFREEPVGITAMHHLGKLAAAIPFSDAGMTMRETKDLWNLPLVFLVLLLLRFSEWWLRRKWGIV